MHNPLATLKNIRPMKIIMYCIIFCCIRACSSTAGGMNIFCCMMNSPIVNSGSRLKYGPSAKMPTPALNQSGMKPLQS